MSQHNLSSRQTQFKAGPLQPHLGAKECTPVPEQRIDKQGSVGVKPSKVLASLGTVTHQTHE